jgi:hypothetical protein
MLPGEMKKPDYLEKILTARGYDVAIESPLERMAAMSRRLGNESMSAYLNCGESFTGPVANNYRIYISLMSIVRPDGKGASELETAFSAQAQNMEGTSGDRIACGSTGRLEERIRKSVLLKVGSVPS